MQATEDDGAFKPASLSVLGSRRPAADADSRVNREVAGSTRMSAISFLNGLVSSSAVPDRIEGPTTETMDAGRRCPRDSGDTALQNAQPKRRRLVRPVNFPTWAPPAVKNMFRKWSWRGRGLGKREDGVLSVDVSGSSVRKSGLGYSGVQARDADSRRAGIRRVPSTTSVARIVLEQRPPAEPPDVTVPCNGADDATPAWVLSCIVPVLSLVEGFDGRICGPLGTGGPASRAWRELGIRHEGPDGPFPFVDHPGKLDSLFRGECPLLKRRGWAVLVPTSFCTSSSFDNLGPSATLTFVHVAPPVGQHLMSWVVRGAIVAHDTMTTTDGSSYWTVDGRHGPLTPSDLRRGPTKPEVVVPEGEPTTAGGSRPRGVLKFVFDRRHLWRWLRGKERGAISNGTVAAAAAPAVTVEDSNGDDQSEEDLRWACLLAAARSQKASGMGISRSVVDGIVGVWKLAAVSVASGVVVRVPTLFAGGEFSTSLDILKGSFVGVSAVTADSAVFTFATMIEKGLLKGPDVRRALVAASAVVGTNVSLAGRVVRLAVPTLMAACSEDKGIIRAGRFCISRALEADSEAALRAVVDAVSEGSSNAAPLPCERVRFILAAHLTSDTAVSLFSDNERFKAAVRFLAPTSDSPTGVFVRDGGPGSVALTPPSRVGRRSVLLWNVDGLRARRGEVLRLLEARSPTVAVFCEIKQPAEAVENDTAFLSSMAKAGYPYVYVTSCTRESAGPWNFGVMIVSRVRPESYSFGVGHRDLDREGRSITVRFTDFTLVGGYSPCTRPGEGVSKRRVEYDNAMKLHLLRERDKGSEIIYAADVNVAPSPADVDSVGLTEAEAAAAPGCTTLERGLLADVMGDVCMTDVYRHHHPGHSASDFTWRTRQPRRPAEARGHKIPAAMRIDMFLATAGVLASSRSCNVLRQGTSDHYPLLMSVETPDGADLLDSDLGRASTALADYGQGKEATAVFSRLSLCAAVHERGPPVRSEADSDDDDHDAPSGDSPGVDDHCPIEGGCAHDDSGHSGPAWVPLRRECPMIDVVFKPRRAGSDWVRSVPLVDSGSGYSLVTEGFLSSVSSRTRGGARMTPIFTLADGSYTRPLRLVRLAFTIGGVRFGHDFWVMKGGPSDVILGSDFLGARGGTIDYGARCVSLVDDEGLNVSSPFVSGAAPEVSPTCSMQGEAAAPLYARETVTLLPGHQHFVPVATSRRCHVPDGSWGIVLTSASNSRFICARGVTTLERQANWVQLFNVTDQPVVVRAGQHVADFHRQDKGMFDVHDWDLDVEERVSAALREQDAHTAVPAAASTESAPVGSSESDIDRAFTDPESRLHEITFGAEVESDPEALRSARQLIYRYRHLWDKPNFAGGGSGASHDVTCDIELEGTFKSKARVRSVSPAIRDTIAKEVAAQRQAGIIEPSASPYASTVLLVPKSDGSVRFCVDYRALNSVTKRDGYLMPRVDDSLAALNGSRFFTSLDLTAAFNQIPMGESSKDLTSFSTPDGTFRYNRMPFGLVNGPAVFHRFIDNVMAGLKWSVCMVYMDDVLIYSRTFAEHLEAMEAVFARIDENGLRFKAKKCYVGVDEVKFLGHVVCRDGIKPDPDKTKAIREMPIPADAAEMRSALGLFSYYRKFCKSFAEKARPLNDAVLKGARLQKGPAGQVEWTTEQLEAFESLRSVLVSDPVLSHPDWNRPFLVHTDWCKNGIGAVLSQEVDGVERVVCYASRSLKEHEKKYAAYEGECLAVIWATSLWYSTYLYGRRFTVVTDNEALTWLFTKAPNQSRIQKWVIMMQDLSFDTRHRAGSKHGNADGLSRCPLPSTKPYGEEDVEPLYGASPPISCAVSSSVNRPVLAAAVGDEVNSSSAYFPPVDCEAWSDKEWRALQLKDPDCQSIMSSAKSPVEVQEGEQPPTGARFVLISGVLHWVPSPPSEGRKHRNTSRRSRRDYGRPRRVVPRSLRMFVLRRHHGLPLSGHDGRTRVYAAISAGFWWKGMYSDVKRWVRACSVCCRRKTPRPAHSGIPATVTSPYPFHTVCIDIVGPLPVTASGNKWILTMSDRFTRWPIAVPLADTTTATGKRGLAKSLFFFRILKSSRNFCKR